MKITRKNLDEAASANVISPQQAEALFQFLKNNPAAGAQFDLTHVLYYLGGFIAIGAMSFFMNLGFEAFGGWGIFFIALLYAGIGLWLTERFAIKERVVPAGICATFAVALTPLAIYGLQLAMGWWPDDSTYNEYHRYIKWHWIYLELATLVVGLVVAYRYKYPFLVMPIAVTLWYMSMDVAQMLTANYYDFEFRMLITMLIGAMMTLIAFWVDLRASHKADYAFWLYLFGVLAFWCGLTAQDSDNELSKFMYCLINLSMILIGVALVRRIFVVCGALGVCFYLGYLAFDVFENSWLFPIVLTVMGLAVIYLGVLWQKNEQMITQKVRGKLPESLQLMLSDKH
ncbi:MAG: hypothetical protein Alis3KO_27070 [Aliiglaciecola sp.]